MSTADLEPLPPALREALRRDSAPVAPLLSPGRRAATMVVPTGLIVGMAVYSYPGVDHALPLFSLSGGGVSLVLWLAGLALLWLALREAVPGLGLGPTRAALAVGGGIGLQVMLGMLLWWQTGRALSASDGLAVGFRCATAEGWIGLPHLAVATWLAVRALPLRPRWSGALTGAASALLADAIWHLACPRTDLEHLVVWHLSATLLLTLVGSVAGSLWPRRLSSPG